MPFRIVEAKRLSSITNLFQIEAATIAKKARAGQFIVLRLDEKGERIPLTITRRDPAKGTITIIFQEVGKTTKKLASLKKGDKIQDIIGPLGKKTDFGYVGKAIFIGGGVGVAEILPVVEYAKESGNGITVIIGARTKELVILEEELRKLAPRLIVMTDDGSHGRKGLVTTPLKELLTAEKFDLAYCVGPDIMMKVTCDVTKEFKLKTLVSLDSNMVDATGMCGTCRVSIGGATKFVCVDGPEFEGHLVDWDLFLKRQKRFVNEEKKSIECNEANAQCRCRA